MIMLMLDSGMRLGECSTVLVTDLELARKRINLRAEETKGRKDRTVYFSPKTESVIRRWLQFKDRYVESDYLFPVKEHGGSIGVGNFETNFKRYILRAGLNEEYTPHCLRNNFAKRCLMNGMDIFTLSKILGHSSVEVTEQAYLDLTDEDISKQYHRASPLSNFECLYSRFTQLHNKKGVRFKQESYTFLTSFNYFHTTIQPSASRL